MNQPHPRHQHKHLLLLTDNTALWQQWHPLNQHGWATQRGRSQADWQQWKQQGQHWALLDAALPGLPDWSARANGPLFDGMHVLVLSAHPSDAQGQHALMQGASGYAHAHSPVEHIASMLHTIAQGNIWTGRSLLQRLLRDLDQRLPAPPALPADTQPAAAQPTWATPLTAREQAVAHLAALGRSNQDIAQQLAITERTVRAHLSATFDKLQVSDRLQLALKVHGING